MHDAQGCMTCGQMVSPYEICKPIGSDVWYVRYHCPTDQRKWKSRLLEWTETLRAAWYRDNALSKEGLEAAPSAMPWKVAE